MRTRTGWPTNFSISATSRVPERDEGIKARMPMSTVKPPFTTPVTVPETVPLASNASSSEL